MNKSLALSLIAVLGLVACASEPRQGPPAPVVRVTPRDGAPATAPSNPAQTQAAPPSEARVFAYRDPAESDVEPVENASSPPPSAPLSPSSSAMVALPPPETATRQPPPRETPAAPKVAATPATPATPKAPAVSATPTPRPVQPAPQPKPGSTLPPAERSVAMAPAPAPAPIPAPVAIAVPSLPPAADALARQAEQQRQSGDYAGAAASLERSLRIAPNESYLWNRLARVRLEQGQYPLAGNLASRSNGLASAESGIKRDNWRIIAEARRRAGDSAGASEAERRANGG